MKMIENWATVSGTILDIAPDNAMNDFAVVKLKTAKVDGYQSYPNLVRPDDANIIKVKLSHSKLASLNLSKNMDITAVVRAAPAQSYFFEENSIKTK